MKAINYTVTPAGKGENKRANIVLEGELTLANIQGIVQELTEAIYHYVHVNIEVKNVLNIDLTAIQLLLAISKTASEMNKQVHFDIHLPDEMQVIMEHAGFGNLTTLLAGEK